MPKGVSWKLRVKRVFGRGEGEVRRARLSWWREAVRDCFPPGGGGRRLVRGIKRVGMNWGVFTFDISCDRSFRRWAWMM